VTPILGAVEYGGPWEVPPIGELFNFPPIPGTEDWGIFAVNRVTLMLLTSTLILCAFFYTAFARPKIVPNRLQGLAESIVDFIRERIAIEIIGPYDASTQTYPMRSFDNQGNFVTMRASVSEDGIWTFAGESERATLTVGDDGTP
jgi:hypothetical protein